MSIFDLGSTTPGGAAGGQANKIANVTLVSGVGTINDANVSTSSNAFAQLVTPGGTLANGYKCVCTAGVVTITSVSSGGTTQALDTSTLRVEIFY